MVKMVYLKPVSLLITLILFISFFIQTSPVSLADGSYGAVTGRVLDNTGMPLANASVDIVDYSGKNVGNAVTAENGTFVLNNIPIVGADGRNTFRVSAKYEYGGKTYTDKTIFFWVYKNQVVNQDVIIYYFPPSGQGWITGKVVNADNFNTYLSATVYVNNGLYDFVTDTTGSKFQFNMPAGDYTIWAEHIENGKMYVSDNYTVHVDTDDTHTISILISLRNNASTVRPPPLPGVNTIRGQITQLNGMPLSDATIDLCKLNGRNLLPMMTTTTSAAGNYEFDNVSIVPASENYVVRVSYKFNDTDYTKVSDAFTVYNHNMLGVSHDITVPVTVDFIDSGSLTIITNPPGAHVWIDGYDTGKQTPYNFTGIKSGAHELGILLDGYLPENLTVAVDPQNATKVAKTLKRSTGDVFFDVHPEDALIYVNGNLIGKGPTNLTKVQYGTYTYIVSRDGYWNVTGSFEVLAGEDMTVPVNMAAVPGLSLTYIGYLINNMLTTIGKLF